MRAAPKPEPAKGAYRPPGARGLVRGWRVAGSMRPPEHGRTRASVSRNLAAEEARGSEAPGRRRARGRALAQRAAQGGREEAQVDAEAAAKALGPTRPPARATRAKDVATMAPDELLKEQKNSRRS